MRDPRLTAAPVGRPILMDGPVFRELLALGDRPESGGLLGLDREGRLLYSYDAARGGGHRCYCPDPVWAAEQANRWAEQSVRLAGLAHSHPPGRLWLSPKDVATARDFLTRCPGLDALFMAVVSTMDEGNRVSLFRFDGDGGITMHPITKGK